MASYDAQIIPLDPNSSTAYLGRAATVVPREMFGGSVHRGKPADWKFYPVPIGAQYRYRMRAWNTVTGDWEIWTSAGSPDTNPPSGDPVTNVTLIGISEE